MGKSPLPTWRLSLRATTDSTLRDTDILSVLDTSTKKLSRIMGSFLSGRRVFCLIKGQHQGDIVRGKD